MKNHQGTGKIRIPVCKKIRKIKKIFGIGVFDVGRVIKIDQCAVTNSALVYLDKTTNIKYTYPENLFNLSDFLANWNPNFARSLVVFHPEYAYYLSCSDQ